MCDTNHIDYSYDHTNEDISISKRNKVRNTILSELRALANKNTATHNTFEQSMRHIYESLEHAAQENAELNIEMIPMYKHRQTKRAYRRNIQPKDISTDQLKRLCKQLHIQQNIQKKNIKEIAEFLQTKNK
jgi:nucleoid DNA-binding protein